MQLGGPCFAQNSIRYACPPTTCFCSPVWSADEILNVTNITYSSKYNLAMRLFTPPTTGARRDTRAVRPAIVAIHGGHFEGGNLNETGCIDWCTRWARTGIVCSDIL